MSPKNTFRMGSITRSLQWIDHPEAEYPSKMASFIKEI